MKKIIMVIIVILALLCALILGIGGNYLYNLAVNPSVSKDMVFNSSKNDVTQEETSGYVTEETKNWLEDESGYSDVYITSDDGLKLHNYKIINEFTINKWVIRVLGYTSSGVGMAYYVEKFFNLGFNVMIPDL